MIKKINKMDKILKKLDIPYKFLGVLLLITGILISVLKIEVPAYTSYGALLTLGGVLLIKD